MLRDDAKIDRRTAGVTGNLLESDGRGGTGAKWRGGRAVRVDAVEAEDDMVIVVIQPSKFGRVCE
jgi:hypothetical protein